MVPLELTETKKVHIPYSFSETEKFSVLINKTLYQREVIKKVKKLTSMGTPSTISSQHRRRLSRNDQPQWSTLPEENLNVMKENREDTRIRCWLL